MENARNATDVEASPRPFGVTLRNLLQERPEFVTACASRSSVSSTAVKSSSRVSLFPLAGPAP